MHTFLTGVIKGGVLEQGELTFPAVMFVRLDCETMPRAVDESRHGRVVTVLKIVREERDGQFSHVTATVTSYREQSLTYVWEAVQYMCVLGRLLLG